ncbi:MAG: hypothetical protein AAB401_03565, partial [Acidobacteriota bacterium]
MTADNLTSAKPNRRIWLTLLVVLALSLAAWRGSASGKFGITEQSRVGKLIAKVAPQAFKTKRVDANPETFAANVKETGTAPAAGYMETFSTPNKGYLVNCVDDFTGVNWSISPWDPVGTCRISPPDAVTDIQDPVDYFNTTTPAGKLECVDLDEPVYWESPLLSISNPGTV